MNRIPNPLYNPSLQILQGYSARGSNIFQVARHVRFSIAPAGDQIRHARAYVEARYRLRAGFDCMITLVYMAYLTMAPLYETVTLAGAVWPSRMTTSGAMRFGLELIDIDTQKASDKTPTAARAKEARDCLNIRLGYHPIGDTPSSARVESRTSCLEKK